MRALRSSSSFGLLSSLALFGLACGAPPAPPPAPPAPVASAPSAPAPPSAAELAQRAQGCAVVESGAFAPGCAALEAFLAPAIVRSEGGRRELARLVRSQDVKAQALGARGYAVAVDKEAPLTVEELRAVLTLFEATTRPALVSDLAAAIRATVTARPGGREAEAFAAYVAEGGARRGTDGAVGRRAEALLQGRDVEDATLPALLFRSTDPWTSSQGRDALLEAKLSPEQRCDVLVQDLTSGVLPQRNYLDALRFDCAEAERMALAAVVKDAKRASWNPAAQLILSWPFDDLVAVCAQREERRPKLVAALREVIAGGADVEQEIRLRAFDDLATCDRAAAKETAKAYVKDKDAEIAATAKLLLRPEPKGKKLKP